MNKKKVKDLIKNTFLQLNKIIKRRFLKEGFGKYYKSLYENELEKRNPTDLSLPDKRKLLKKIYAQTLTQMGLKQNIPVFNEIIDSVPESYLDYELQIDLPKAGEFVKDLYTGKDKLADNELLNMINIVKGIGIPAIEQHASGKEKLPKDTADFGSKAINKNVSEYLTSKEKRKDPRFQLDSPKFKELETTALTRQTKDLIKTDDPELFARRLLKVNLNSNSKLAGLASKLKGVPGESYTNLSNRLSDIFIKSDSYEEAKKMSKDKDIGIEFTKNEYDEFIKNLNKSKEEEPVERKIKKENLKKRFT